MVTEIGELSSLEILCLDNCGFEVLPEEIGKLKKLRQLDIFECGGLRRIVRGVISGLERLEELLIAGSFNNWEAAVVEDNDNGIANASLAELERLNRLATLKIEIRDPKAIPTHMPHWVQKVKNYSIHVSTSISNLRYNKVICVGSEAATPFPDWFWDWASDAECLHLKGPSCAIVNRLADQSRYQNCVECHLDLSDCTNVQYLAKGQQDGAIFSKLEILHIYNSCSLQGIYNVPPPPGSFQALKRVNIENCQSLSCLFLLSVVAQSWSQLESLEVSNCPILEEIFKMEDGETEHNKIQFPKLNTLTLISLNSFCRLSKGVDAIEVPAMRHLELKNLPSIMEKGDHNIHPLFPQVSLEDNCFAISPRELSFSFDYLPNKEEEEELDWFVAPGSSESFVDAVRLPSGVLVEITGKIETIKLEEGVAYDIIFMIMLGKISHVAEHVKLKLTPPGAITQEHTKSLDEVPRDKWIEISAGRFTRMPNQIGELEFSLACQQDESSSIGKLSIKGVKIWKMEA